MLGIVVHPNLEALAEAVAEESAAVMRRNPSGLVSLPTGPLFDAVYARIAGNPSYAAAFRDAALVSASERFRNGAPDAPLHRDLLRDRFLAPLGIDPSRLRSFDADAAAPETECLRMDIWLDTRGPIRLFLAEVDGEGRIGLVQRGTAVRLRSHAASYLPKTTGGDPLFGRPAPVRLGLTLGLQDFVSADHCLVAAAGAAAGASIRRALGGLVSEDYPAAAMRLCRVCHLAVDAAAAETIGEDLLRRFPCTPLDDAPDPFSPPV